ncbi:anillin-like isoform X2 [Spea bombifrons]|uniref:anillin-like isoform X2 n=1 Tax=Spea bombifrons TaxID=233779 RepID=UPI00234AD4D1|nr:anillin-like isoform X2 [Spea bombifrons]
MESRRQPLKRLCQDSGIESPRKRRLTEPEGGSENCDPLLLEEAAAPSDTKWSTLLRITEHEIKPDTPAIPSVRSRIQMLREVSRTDAAPSSEGDSDVAGEKSCTGDMKDFSVFADPEQKKEAEKITGQSVGSMLEKFEWNPTVEGGPLAHSTLNPLQKDKVSSFETVRRLRKERDEELAMVCAVVDRTNPWRAESMRQKRSEELVSVGSDSGVTSLESRDMLLDVSGERYVSTLEVRLRRTPDSDCSMESRSHNQEYSASRSPEHTELQRCDGGSCSESMEEVRGQATMDNSELIDRLFEGVLDSSSGSGEDPLDLPPLSLLSPLTKSADLQAAISPLNSVVSSLPELLVESPATPRPSAADETSLLYSIDTYRTMRRNVRGEPDTSLRVKLPKTSPKQGKAIDADLKEKIKLLSKEVSSLQRIIEQSCRALSCCVDAEHGKGSLQEAEAERLLLVSVEKREALLKELGHLRSERSEDVAPSLPRTLRPCHGSVTISDIRLPLKVDYVCSSIREAGNPSHYFLILIRYGAHDIVATPLASAADAQTGDTILFPTTVSLKEASSDFRIEIEVYSLAQGGPLTVVDKRKSLKPKITPKKLLSSRKSSLNSPACSPALGSYLRSSNFLLVGSLTLSLESLGKFRFPLEKVPFLSPLEGSLYLTLQCESHSTVHHRGFLTTFEDVGGLGAWHRRWCVLLGTCLSFWTYPDQEPSSEPLGQINLANCTSVKIEAAKREACARPHTLELVTMRPQREGDTDTLVTQCRNTLCFTKNWLSADTKEERNQWMECLNQVLVDLRTWRTSPGRLFVNSQGGQPPNPSEC